MSLHNAFAARLGGLAVVAAAAVGGALDTSASEARGVSARFGLTSPPHASGIILYEADLKCGEIEDPRTGEFCTRTLWTVNVRTGVRRNLTPRSGGWDAVWSPDGRVIAYVSFRDGELWTMRANGSAKRRLTRTRGAAVSSPSWSPDGRRLAFVGGGENKDIEVINADGTGRRVIVRYTWELGLLTWSPDGSALAYVASGPGRTSVAPPDRIFVVHPSGGPRRVASGGRPVWSPDGSQIAFVDELDGNVVLTVIGADGTGRRRLTRGAFDTDPAWSPDGRELAFTRLGETFLQAVYRIRADGSGLRGVVMGGQGPAWSPAGPWIAYADDVGRLAIVRPDGTGRTRLGVTGTVPLWRPAVQNP